MINTHALRDLEAWIKTKPMSLNKDRMVIKTEMFNEFWDWCRRKRLLRHNRNAIGMALKEAIPGIYGRQIQRDGERLMVYVLPYDPQEVEPDDCVEIWLEEQIDTIAAYMRSSYERWCHLNGEMPQDEIAISLKLNLSAAQPQDEDDLL